MSLNLPAPRHHSVETLPRLRPALFAAFANEKRRQMLMVLAAGPLRPGALAARAGLSRNQLTFHLHVLSRAGLARWRRGLVAAEPEGIALFRAYIDATLRLAARHAPAAPLHD